MFQWTGSDNIPIKRMIRAAIVYSLVAVFFCVLLFPSRAVADNVWTPLVDRLVADGYDRTYISALFSRKSLSFSPEVMAHKMNVLLNAKLAAKQTGPRQQPEILDRYLNPILLAGAYAFLRDHKADFVAIEKKYMVQGEVLTALMLVETKLGTQVGKHNGLTILASMALGGNFELIRPRIKRKGLSDKTMKWLIRRTEQKGSWGYEELKALITYARKNGKDPLNIPSSIYGAIGQCQFIPSSALHYGKDGTGDGIVDLFDTTDALHSMAYFVKKHGWKKDLDYEGQLKVIYRYNHSESYAMTILAVADRLRKTKEFFGN